MHIPTPERIPLPVPLPGLYSPPAEKRPPQEAQGPAGDGDLLSRIAQGDLDSFQAFYGRYAGRVLAYARQLSRNRDGVEDVVQEVFVAVWRRAASYRPDRGDPAGWLYTITRNKLVDHWRRLGAPGEPGDPGDLPFHTWEDGGDLRLTMRQALAQVAPEQRRAIEMAYFGGLTYEETAQRLDLPVGTLKSRIRSGLKRLRTLLEGS